MNIMSLAMQYLGPAIANKIATSLGINNSLVTKAIEAALPAIMAAFAGRASTSVGAQSLFDTATQQDPGFLGNLENLIGGSAQADAVKYGNDTLSSMLGGSMLGSLNKAVGKHAGIDNESTQSLMGMLAPVVLGTLGGQVRDQNLDARGLANLMSDQKTNIASAMPHGFDQLLSGTGILDSIGDQLKSGIGGVTSAAHETASDIGAAARRTANNASDAVQSGSPNFLPWVAAALVGLGLVWYFVSGSGSTALKKTSMAPQSLNVGGVNVGEKFGSLFGNMKTALGGIKDAASAKSALPKLTAANSELDKLTQVAGKLSGDGKKSFASIVAKALKELAPMIEAALKATGAGPIVKPALDLLKGKLDKLAQA